MSSFLIFIFAGDASSILSEPGDENHSQNNSKYHLPCTEVSYKHLKW